MATDARQERQLMRQRGAGSRQINNIDFGFAFSTPSQLRRSRTRSRTPQTATHDRRQSFRKPNETTNIRISNPPLSTHSTRRAHSERVDDEDGGTSTLGRPPLKRRRLSEVSNLSNVTNNIPILHITNEIIREAEETRVNQVGRDDSDENVKGAKYMATDALGEDKENDVNPLYSDRPGFKRGKRKSTGQQRTQRKRPSIHPSAQSPTLQEPQSDTRNEGEKRLDDRPNSSALIATQIQEDVALGELVDLPIAQSKEPFASSGGALVPKERRRKKSILFTKRKRRSTGSTNRTSVPVSADISQHDPNNTLAPTQEEWREDRSDSGFGDEQEQADHDTRTDVQNPLYDHARKSKRNQEGDLSENSEASDQEYHPDEASPDPTPMPNRTSELALPKQKTKNRSKNITAGNTENKRSTSTFPVLTHRITNIQQLPTIPEASEVAETNEIELSAHPPSFTTHDAPNAVDVLSQICRETIDSAIAGLQNQPQTGATSKASVKQKSEALQAFQTELDDRLFDVSQSLDQRMQLEARLRKTRRDKTSVQAQWLEVRKRRDQIALRIDIVRRRHWENELVGRKTWEASDAAMRLEAEIQKDGEDEGEQADSGQLEIMLRSLASDVSSLNGGGLLQRLRGVNARLEKFAASIEGQ